MALMVHVCSCLSSSKKVFTAPNSHRDGGDEAKFDKRLRNPSRSETSSFTSVQIRLVYLEELAVPLFGMAGAMIDKLK